MLQPGLKQLFSVKICFNGLLGIGFLQSRKWTKVFIAINLTAVCFAKASRLEHIFWGWTQSFLCLFAHSGSLCRGLLWTVDIKVLRYIALTHRHTHADTQNKALPCKAGLSFLLLKWMEHRGETDIYCTAHMHCCRYLHELMRVCLNSIRGSDSSCSVHLSLSLYGVK